VVLAWRNYNGGYLEGLECLMLPRRIGMLQRSSMAQPISLFFQVRSHRLHAGILGCSAGPFVAVAAGYERPNSI
jgi:hypothetical protein